MQDADRVVFGEGEGATGPREGVLLRRDRVRDDQWAQIEQQPLGRVGDIGGTARDNWLFMDAVLYHCRASIPGATCPCAWAAGKTPSRGSVAGRRAAWGRVPSPRSVPMLMMSTP